jgi:hypothetical protein
VDYDTFSAQLRWGATIGGYCDSALIITWLADANAARYAMNWSRANSWVSTLTVGTGMYAVSRRRLPAMTGSGTSGCNLGYTGTY